MHSSTVEQRYGSGVAERVQALCRQEAEDDESLLLLCADRVSHLLHWGHLGTPQGVARELHALRLSLRRLSSSAQQILASQLDSVVPPLVALSKRRSCRASKKLPAARGAQQQVR